MPEESKQPGVSVVIPAFNTEDCIAKSIRSVISQTRKADEIIVVNDGSTDNTESEIKKFGDAVRYIHQENAGVSAARNHGIKLAEYEWIAFLDSDDEWLPERLEKQLAVTKDNPELMWISGNSIRCLCDEERQSPELDPAKAKKLLKGKNCFENYLYAFRNKAGGNTNTMLIRREVFDKIGMFDESLSYGEDPDMWWRIAYHWPCFGYVSDPLAIYHLTRPSSLSENTKEKQIQILTKQLQKHLALAEEYGQIENFKPLASFLVKSWIRGLLFANQPELIRVVMENFGYLLPFHFRILGLAAMEFPSGTAKVCHIISRCIRTMGIRKQVQRRPLRMVKK